MGGAGGVGKSLGQPDGGRALAELTFDEDLYKVRELLFDSPSPRKGHFRGLKFQRRARATRVEESERGREPTETGQRGHGPRSQDVWIPFRTPAFPWSKMRWKL